MKNLKETGKIIKILSEIYSKPKIFKFASSVTKDCLCFIYSLYFAQSLLSFHTYGMSLVYSIRMIASFVVFAIHVEL